MKSIRQTAEDLRVTHTAVRQAIAAIEAETGKTIGRSQGRGMAKLLDQQEQELIARRFYKPEPAQPAPIVHQEVEAPILFHRVGQVTLKVPDSSSRINQAVTELRENLDQFKSNRETIESALIRFSADSGKDLGTRMAVTKVANAVQKSEAVELELLKKLGLAG